MMLRVQLRHLERERSQTNGSLIASSPRSEAPRASASMALLARGQPNGEVLSI